MSISQSFTNEQINNIYKSRFDCVYFIENNIRLESHNRFDLSNNKMQLTDHQITLVNRDDSTVYLMNRGSGKTTAILLKIIWKCIFIENYTASITYMNYNHYSHSRSIMTAILSLLPDWIIPAYKITADTIEFLNGSIIKFTDNFYEMSQSDFVFMDDIDESYYPAALAKDVFSIMTYYPKVKLSITVNWGSENIFKNLSFELPISNIALI